MVDSMVDLPSGTQSYIKCVQFVHMQEEQIFQALGSQRAHLILQIDRS